MEALADSVFPVFERLVVVSAKTAIVIGMIFLLRFLFSGRMNPHLGYLMWMVLVLELALPFEIETSLSPYGLMQIQNRMRPVAGSAAGESPLALDSGKTKKQAASAGIETVNDVPRSGAGSVLSIIIAASPVVWLAGSIALAAVVFVKNARFRRVAGRGKPIRNPAIVDLLESCRKKLDVRSKVTILESETLGVPCTYGITKKSIILPRSLIASAPEIECILLHELAHVKRRDMLAEAVMTVLQVIYWFNPLVWLAFRIAREDREYACDATVLSVLGKGEARAYGMTLLNQLRRFNQIPSPECALGITDTKNNLTRRFRLIAGYKKRSRSIPVIAAAFLLCATFFNTKPAVTAVETGNTGSVEDFYASPVDDPEITSEFGWAINPFTKDKYFHDGMDMTDEIGTPVRAIDDGSVLRVSDTAAGIADAKTSASVADKDALAKLRLSADLYGNFVVVSHADGFVSLYSKLDSIAVKADGRVKKGEVIGYMGSTGVSTGPHLHFTLYRNGTPVNPREYILF